VATTSISPPSVSPADWAASIRATISASAAGSSTRTGERSAAALSGCGSSDGAAARMPPRETT
jgi:hypothetical protein